MMLKNIKSFRQTIAIGSACLAVIVCAVAIPVGVHNSNIKKAAVAENTTVGAVSETTTELTTIEETTVLPEGYETTIIEADGTTKVDLVVKTTTQVTQPAINAPAENSGATTTKKASSGKNNGVSGNAGTKTTTTKAPVVTNAPETTTGYNYNWSQSQVDSFVAKSRAYGESIGLVWNENMNLDNSSWQQSVHSRYSGKSEEDIFNDMKGLLTHTRNYNEAKQFKIYVERNDGGWEFVVLWLASSVGP